MGRSNTVLKQTKEEKRMKENTSNKRARKQANKKEEYDNFSELKNALDFVGKIQLKDSDIIYKKHCLINRGYVVATNGEQLLGTQCKGIDSLSFCPSTFKFLKSLEVCGKEAALKTTDGKLQVISSKLKTFIELIPFEAIPVFSSDFEIEIKLQESFLEDLKLSRKFLSDEKDSYLIVSKTVLTCFYKHNVGVIAIFQTSYKSNCKQEFIVNIPLEALDIIISIKKPIIKMLISRNRSCTFVFEDFSFMQTLLVNNSEREKSANVDALFKAENKIPFILTKEFFESLKNVSEFVDKDSKFVFFKDNSICSHKHIELGAASNINTDVLNGYAFNYALLIKLEGLATEINLTSRGLFFQNENTRACLARVHIGD